MLIFGLSERLQFCCSLVPRFFVGFRIWKEKYRFFLCLIVVVDYDFNKDLKGDALFHLIKSIKKGAANTFCILPL